MEEKDQDEMNGRCGRDGREGTSRYERQFFSPFDHRFIKTIFHGNHTLFIGDSIMRGIYKDLVTLINQDNDDLTKDWVFKVLAEPSHEGDRQIDSNIKYQGERVWRQAREYHTENHLIQFHFTTRYFKEDLDCAIAQMVRDNKYPRMVFINSCLWDITRYHELGIRSDENADDQDGREIQRKILEEFQNRCGLLCSRLRLALPATSHVYLVLLPHCVPVSERFTEGFKTRDGDTRENKHLIRVLYVKANKLAAQIARLEGFSVIDLDYRLSSPYFEELRIKDGIHWDNRGTRIMLQFIIMHLVNDLQLYLPKYILERLRKMYFSATNYASDILKVLGEAEKRKRAVAHIPVTSPVDGETKYESVQLIGPYYEFLQTQLQEKLWEQLGTEKQQMIKNDIDKMRVALFLQHGGVLASEDHAKFEEWLKEGQESLKLSGSASIKPPLQFIGIQEHRDDQRESSNSGRSGRKN